MATSNLSLYRGVAYAMNYTHTSPLTGGTVYFTVKPNEYDSNLTDSDATPKKTITSFTNGGLTASWTLTDLDMYIEPGKYYYDIIVEGADKLALPPIFEGQFKVSGHPTNRNVGNE